LDPKDGFAQKDGLGLVDEEALVFFFCGSIPAKFETP